MRFLAGFAASMAVGAATSAYHAGAVARASPVPPKEPFTGSFKAFPIGEIIEISHDTRIFRFLFDDPEMEYRLKTGSALQARMKQGESAMDLCQRLYTPVTVNGNKGYFDIIVKKLPNGRMSGHMFNLKVGKTLDFRSISLNMEYKANKWEKIGMIAGGVGFTPMLQVINHALSLPEDKTQMSFLFCNKTPSDILLKDYFDDLEAKNPKRLKMHYCIDKMEPGWTGLTGYATVDMLKKTMPPPDAKKNLVLLCGPDKMVNKIGGISLAMLHTMSSGYALQPVAPGLNNLAEVGGLLGEMGYSRDNVYIF